MHGSLFWAMDTFFILKNQFIKKNGTIGFKNIQNGTKKEYFNKLSIERINFKFEEYENYPEVNMKPSIFFLKFLFFSCSFYPSLRLTSMGNNKQPLTAFH